MWESKTFVVANKDMGQFLFSQPRVLRHQFETRYAELVEMDCDIEEWNEHAAALRLGADKIVKWHEVLWKIKDQEHHKEGTFERLHWICDCIGNLMHALAIAEVAWSTLVSDEDDYGYYIVFNNDDSKLWAERISSLLSELKEFNSMLLLHCNGDAANFVLGYIAVANRAFAATWSGTLPRYNFGDADPLASRDPKKDLRCLTINALNKLAKFAYKRKIAEFAEALQEALPKKSVGGGAGPRRSLLVAGGSHGLPNNDVAGIAKPFIPDDQDVRIINAVLTVRRNKVGIAEITKMDKDNVGKRVDALAEHGFLHAHGGGHPKYASTEAGRQLVEKAG